MIALLIFFGLVMLLLLLLLLPVGASVIYDQNGAAVRLLIGHCSICLYPRPSKKLKKSKRQPNRKRKEKSKTREKEPIGGRLPLFRQLLSLGLEALNCLRRKLVLKNLVLYLTVGGQGEDPAASAVAYGRAWAAIGSLTPVLDSTFQIRDRDVRVDIDFSSSETVIYARGSILLRVGDVLWIALFYGIRGLKLFLNDQKKGGKQNGTSNQ